MENHVQPHFPILNETPTSSTQEGPCTLEEPNEHLVAGCSPTDSQATVFDEQGSLDYWVACSCHKINNQQHKSQNHRKFLSKELSLPFQSTGRGTQMSTPQHPEVHSLRMPTTHTNSPASKSCLASPGHWKLQEPRSHFQTFRCYRLQEINVAGRSASQLHSTAQEAGRKWSRQGWDSIAIDSKDAQIQLPQK